MTKSQFNIKISKELLARVKRQAMMMGKSLTEHITDLVTKSLSECENKTIKFNSNYKLNDFEERLLNIESTVKNREYLAGKLKPFTQSEAINCTKFMKGVFNKEVEIRNFENKYLAYDDFFSHIKVDFQLFESFSDRLKEIMLNDTPNPWTENELNNLVGEDKCKCPIRKGLINWTRKFDFPSQQEICDKGENLLSLI